jgi:hypothetical protein
MSILHQHICENYCCHDWVYNVRDLLCTTGFSYVWETPYVISEINVCQFSRTDCLIVAHTHTHTHTHMHTCTTHAHAHAHTHIHTRYHATIQL